MNKYVFTDIFMFKQRVKLILIEIDKLNPFYNTFVFYPINIATTF